VLGPDGTYFPDPKSDCRRACDVPRETGRYTASAPRRGDAGTLTLKPTRGEERTYHVVDDRLADVIKLSSDGRRYVAYANVHTFCREDADCEKQSMDRGACNGPGRDFCETGKLGFRDSTSCSWVCTP
jgi:hypothetical protein